MINYFAIGELCKKNLQEIPKEKVDEIINECKYPFAKLRILPKSESFRPLMTFKRKTKFPLKIFGNKRVSLNEILRNSSIVLRNLKAKLGVDLGYSVFDHRQIFKKYETFMEKWKKLGEPELYFITMDIKKCYDSVNPQKLLNFFQKTPLLVLISGFLNHSFYFSGL